MRGWWWRVDSLEMSGLMNCGQCLEICSVKNGAGAEQPLAGKPESRGSRAVKERKGIGTYKTLASIGGSTWSGIKRQP